MSVAAGLIAQRMGFIAFRPIHMMVEAGSRLVGGNVCIQAGGGLEPVIEVMARRTTALLVEMKSVIADIAFAGLAGGKGAVGFIFHR